MDEVFFIDKDGNKIYSDTISSHIGLANLLLEKSPRLKEEFQKSGKIDSVEFLLENKNYLKVSNIGYIKKVSYYSLNLSEKQRKLLEYYHFEEGFELDDLRIIQLQEERLGLD